MDDTLVIGGKQYISARRAAEISKYAKDYIGQMCRSGRLEGKLIGRNWYIDPHALMALSTKGRTKAAAAHASEMADRIPEVSERAAALLEESTFAYEPKEYAFESDDRPLVPEVRKADHRSAPAMTEGHPVAVGDVETEEVAPEEIAEVTPEVVEEEAETDAEVPRADTPEWKTVGTMAGHTERESYYREEIVARKRVSPSKYAVDLRQFSAAPVRPTVAPEEPVLAVRKQAARAVERVAKVKPVRRKRGLLVPALITVSVFAGLVLGVSGAGNRKVEYPENRIGYEVDYPTLEASVVKAIQENNLVEKRNP